MTTCRQCTRPHGRDVRARFCLPCARLRKALAGRSPAFVPDVCPYCRGPVVQNVGRGRKREHCGAPECRYRHRWRHGQRSTWHQEAIAELRSGVAALRERLAAFREALRRRAA